MGTDTHADVWQKVNEQLGGLDALLGFHMLSASRDEVVIEYEVEQKHLQAYGIAHGGVHCAAIESACSTGAAFDAIARGQ